jgi:hypothetical protein
LILSVKIELIHSGGIKEIDHGLDGRHYEWKET